MIEQEPVDIMRRIEALKRSETPKSSERAAEIAQNVQNGDLIQRKAAIDAVGDWIYNPKDLRYHKDVINSITAVQPEQRWIPCSERLPENDNEVLITVWDAEDDYVEVYKGFYQGHEWWTQWCHGCSKIKDEPCGENIVIAWMPLPASYKGE